MFVFMCICIRIITYTLTGLSRLSTYIFIGLTRALLQKQETRVHHSDLRFATLRTRQPTLLLRWTPPLPVSPGLPEVDPTIDKIKCSGYKKLSLLKLLAGFTRKKASTRRVNRKFADSTRNQRVFFSWYLAANYGGQRSSSIRLRVNAVAVVKVLCAPKQFSSSFSYTTCTNDFGAATHNERRFQFWFVNRLFRASEFHG